MAPDGAEAGGGAVGVVNFVTPQDPAPAAGKRPTMFATRATGLETSPMRLEIGPFPAAGGREWVAQARLLVGFVRAGVPMPFAVPPEVLDEFERYFEDWDEAAAVEPFVWSREIDLGVVHPLMTYWFNLAQMLADHPEHQPAGSIEAREFYRHLVQAILGRLAEADPAFAVLADRWPPL